MLLVLPYLEKRNYDLTVPVYVFNLITSTTQIDENEKKLSHQCPILLQIYKRAISMILHKILSISVWLLLVLLRVSTSSVNVDLSNINTHRYRQIDMQVTNLYMLHTYKKRWNGWHASIKLLTQNANHTTEGHWACECCTFGKSLFRHFVFITWWDVYVTVSLPLGSINADLCLK